MVDGINTSLSLYCMVNLQDRDAKPNWNNICIIYCSIIWMYMIYITLTYVYASLYPISEWNIDIIVIFMVVCG